MAVIVQSVQFFKNGLLPHGKQSLEVLLLSSVLLVILVE